ncbi:MAG: hypothetical protein IJY39_04670 [Clostridia bacterium]|nr:hypothetical protein [Clostridia bacterium]
MKKEFKLYNVLFPVWMLWMFPATWLIVIPGNFLIDSIVLLLAMIAFKLTEKKVFYKKNILKVFLFGFLADMIAAGVMLLFHITLEIGGGLADEPILTIPGVLLAAGLIFIFNYFLSFRKEDKSLRLKLALTFAIATAPYTFLIPSSWIYG